MPTAKKPINFISYELKALETYIEQLREFLDKNPPNLATDRLEHIDTGRTIIIKVIATKEAQVKAFTDILKLLPNLLFDLNRLRKEVSSGSKELEIRGGQEMPGFMDNGVDEVEVEEIKPTKESNIPQGEKFDDDTYYEEDKGLPQLPPPLDPTHDDDWMEVD